MDSSVWLSVDELAFVAVQKEAEKRQALQRKGHGEYREVQLWQLALDCNNYVAYGVGGHIRYSYDKLHFSLIW